MGSDGRIEFDVADQDEPQYLSDVVADRPDDPPTPEPAPQPAADGPAEPAPQPAADGPAEPAPQPAADEPAQQADPEPAPAPPETPTRAARSGRRIRRRLPLSTQLAVHGGADADVLEAVPEETSRFVQMFFVLAGTALVSALSMMFALMTGVRISVWIAVPLALVWALIIFNLDRFLTSTMRSTRNVWKLVGLAVPRIFLAALIGVVVAEPLVLQAFQNDIAREVTRPTSCRRRRIRMPSPADPRSRHWTRHRPVSRPSRTRRRPASSRGPPRRRPRRWPLSRPSISSRSSWPRSRP